MIHASCAQSIYKKDSLTLLADSLDKGDHKAALLIRKQALENFKNSSEEYFKYLEAKHYYTQSCVYENRSYDYANSDPNLALTKEDRKKYLDSALNLAYKARKIYKNVKKPDKQFLYDIQNRIYHQTAYLGNWRHALEEAELGYSILMDTLGEKDRVFVNLIYNLGYINTEIGDYSMAVKYYQRSLDLYKDILGENNVDIAQSYTKIAVEYRNLGLRKKELESLLKAKTIWEKLNLDENRASLYNCYGNLFHWYSYYGDFDKAEEYLAKKVKVREKENTGLIGIARNEEEAYEEQLNEWFDLMLHYLRKKDTVNATNNIKKILNKVGPKVDILNFETKIYSLTLKYYSDILKGSEPEKALNFISKAINTQVKYRLVHPTNPIFYQLEKVELLIDLQKIKEGDSYISQLMLDVKTYTPIELFRLFILKGKISDLLDDKISAQEYFDKALLIFDKGEKTQMGNVRFEDLKPIISFESVDGFIQMGDFYFNIFKEKGDNSNLKKAFYRYTLASKIFNDLYLGEQYNNTLYYSYSMINQRLLLCANEDQNNKELLMKTINEIENNGSKLSWSKFIFNNERKQIKLPERLLNKEKELKAELNFYKNKLFDKNESSVDKKRVWKEKIYELDASYLKIQDTIKLSYNNYYQFNFRDFDIESLQNKLDYDAAIIKYIVTNDYVFSIVISKNNIKLFKLGDKKTIDVSLKRVFNIINNRILNYQDELDNLKNSLLGEIPIELYKNITIVPDGSLFYLPFEILIFSKNMPLISYSPSLLLLMEQKNESFINNNIQIGAFAASSSYNTDKSTDDISNSSKLTNVDFEIKNILDIFEGKAFINSSKETFLNQVNNFDILHFSMHSSLNDIDPEFSSLNFYGDEKINRLFISELYNETFKANMVVLSSCDTGNGIYKNGEGVISLSRAFTYAGVPSTVMSLWKVPDKESAILMKLFYQNLKKGQPKDKALFQAKLDYLKNTDDSFLKHPYYWAGFVVSGNTSAITPSTNYILLVLLGLVIVLPIWFVIRKSFKPFK
ncbi:MAG: CHAT domain-containing tetratricopeptide repeat protein [Bacteroidota bacterium]